MALKDRLEKLLAPANATLNGLDFVEIASPDQMTLRFHFLNKVPLQGKFSAADITISGGETVRTVAVLPFDNATAWTLDTQGRPLLTIITPVPGDFSFYTLKINCSDLDPFFNNTLFSFKALCPSDLDCEVPTPPCPLPEGNPPPIDYLAKDFLSFSKALHDFSALRYPEWQERSEADFGRMFLEALASLADDLSYYQDRIAAEARIDTATQRRSLVRLARLVDYEPRPAVCAQVLLQFDVQGNSIPTGLMVSAQQPDGSLIDFMTGTGLIDQATGELNQEAFTTSPRWNRGIQPYFWDDSQSCLRTGSTQMWVSGHGYNFTQGQLLLLDTQAGNPADPPIREVIRLSGPGVEETDFLFNEKVTLITWGKDEALKFDHDLTPDPLAPAQSKTTLAGNLVPATQGRRFVEFFAINQAPPHAAHLPLALERTGPNQTTQYLYPLRNTPLAWLGQTGPDNSSMPEIILRQLPNPGSTEITGWKWRRQLLQAEEMENAFTLDPGSYLVVGRTQDGTPLYDYEGGEGYTIRFGDEVFGAIPAFETVFQVIYRSGGGTIGNVAANAITKVDPATGLVVTNPFGAKGGADSESTERVRRLAPQAFRAKQFRAVRREDYEAAARTLNWVQQAGTVFRWTGSWLTVFTTADPLGSAVVTLDEQLELVNLLNRYRLAGYESYVPGPRYVSLDLMIIVCARPEVYRGDVEQAILEALNNRKAPDGTTGFFYFDRFTFGTPLERSRLEAAIQEAYGVAGVLGVQYRQRGVILDFIDLPDRLVFGYDQILRVDNDPNLPERGSIKVFVEGGK